MAILTFEEWAAIHEMAARRSFTRTLGKYGPRTVDKPVAILTAWRGELLDPAGRLCPESARRRLNDQANLLLAANIRRRGLSYYPVVGAGQEVDERGEIAVNKENSFVVQPAGRMREDEFLSHVRELLFNPTGERGTGPFAHTQWGALVRLPDAPGAFLLHHAGARPAGPQDYTMTQAAGDSSGPRTRGEPYFTQMRHGPRSGPPMSDEFDRPCDVGNAGGRPGRRFVVKDKQP